MFYLGCIIEGHGEIGALPVLLRRIWSLIDPDSTILIQPPWRLSKKKMLDQLEMKKAVGTLRLKMRGQSGAILVLADADDDCPVDLAMRIKSIAAQHAADTICRAVIANREFESWFIASASSLRGKRRLSLDLQTPDDPESIRGAKEWLSKRMGSQIPYSPTTDQASLAHAMDITLARSNSRSFEHLYRTLEDIYQSLIHSAANTSDIRTP